MKSTIGSFLRCPNLSDGFDNDYFNASDYFH